MKLYTCPHHDQSVTLKASGWTSHENVAVSYKMASSPRQQCKGDSNPGCDTQAMHHLFWCYSFRWKPSRTYSWLTWDGRSVLPIVAKPSATVFLFDFFFYEDGGTDGGDAGNVRFLPKATSFGHGGQWFTNWNVERGLSNQLWPSEWDVAVNRSRLTQHPGMGTNNLYFDGHAAGARFPGGTYRHFRTTDSNSVAGTPITLDQVNILFFWLSPSFL